MEITVAKISAPQTLMGIGITWAFCSNAHSDSVDPRRGRESRLPICRCCCCCWIMGYALGTTAGSHTLSPRGRTKPDDIHSSVPPGRGKCLMVFCHFLKCRPSSLTTHPLFCVLYIKDGAIPKAEERKGRIPARLHGLKENHRAIVGKISP